MFEPYVAFTIVFDPGCLTAINSAVDASDAKGEPIHQTLMAKKMQRLDESPDFRPFKFRIQAFTNAFLEEVSGRIYAGEHVMTNIDGVARTSRLSGGKDPNEKGQPVSPCSILPRHSYNQ